jgi:hypothetical protein
MRVGNGVGGAEGFGNLVGRGVIGLEGTRSGVGRGVIGFDGATIGVGFAVGIGDPMISMFVSLRGNSGNTQRPSMKSK